MVCSISSVNGFAYTLLYSLQEIGDIDSILHMFKTTPIPSTSPLSSRAQATERMLQEQLKSSLADAHRLVKQYQIDGLWGDAEYLFRRSLECSDRKYQAPQLGFGDDTTIPSSTALIYEALGDLPHAQTVQETYIERFRILMTEAKKDEETKKLFRLYKLSQTRTNVLDYAYQTFGKHVRTAYILRQATALNLPLISASLFAGFYSQSTSPMEWYAILELAVVYGGRDQLQQLHDYSSSYYLDLSKLLPITVTQASVDNTDFLLQNGANVDARDSLTGATALHLAARAGNVDMCALLLHFKADIEAVDKHLMDEI